MTIVRSGYHFIHDGNFLLNRPNGSGDYLLVLLKTPAIFFIDGEKKLAPKNSIVFYKKGTPQLYQASGSEFINDWIHFDFTEAELKQLKKLDIPFDEIITLSDTAEISDLVRSLSYAYYGKSPFRNESINLYSQLIFIKISEKLHFQTDPQYGSFYESINMLRSSIYNEPYNDWNIDNMSEQVNLSRSYFQHMYKEIIGISAMEDVIQSRIEYAKHLLSTTKATVIYISEQCGYSCEPHFMRQFKKYTGMTPGEYRRQIVKQ